VHACTSHRAILLISTPALSAAPHYTHAHTHTHTHTRCRMCTTRQHPPRDWCRRGCTQPPQVVSPQRVFSTLLRAKAHPAMAGIPRPHADGAGKACPGRRRVPGSPPCAWLRACSWLGTGRVAWAWPRKLPGSCGRPPARRSSATAATAPRASRTQGAATRPIWRGFAIASPNPGTNLRV
jgi:hypothetical protein